MYLVMVMASMSYNVDNIMFENIFFKYTYTYMSKLPNCLSEIMLIRKKIGQNGFFFYFCPTISNTKIVPSFIFSNWSPLHFPFDSKNILAKTN